MATLLLRSAWAKISVFQFFVMAFFSFKTYLISDFLARIRDQRLRIDPCAKFQLHWTKDKGTRILTWNDTKNGLMTSYLPPSDDVRKIFMTVERLCPSVPSCQVWLQLGHKQRRNRGGHNMPLQPIWFQKTPASKGLRPENLKNFQGGGYSHTRFNHNDV